MDCHGEFSNRLFPMTEAVIISLLYICHTVIHRKLQNVVYMKKKVDVYKKKKKKRGAT
jgi:hypothetical protein